MQLEGLGVPTDPQDTGAGPHPAGAEDARVAATVGNWKRKLLDVSKRNRALNFKPTGVSTVTILEVTEAEAPLHFADLAARVASRWDCILSSRRTARVRAVAEMCAREGQLVIRGEFVYPAGPPREATVCSRAGTKIPPERIPPEEYREAILMILRAGDGLDRTALTKAVRGLLGFGRTSPALEEAIKQAINSLAAEETIGEGSTGFRLRR